MLGGIQNKATVLLFINSSSLLNYVPSLHKRYTIGLDNETGDYYVYNDSAWILFKRGVVTNTSSMMYIPTTTNTYYSYVGNASQSLVQREAYNMNAAAAKATKFVLFSNTSTYNIIANTGSYGNVLWNFLTSNVSSSIK